MGNRETSSAEDWKVAVVCPIYQKVDKQDCRNCSEISSCIDNHIKKVGQFDKEMHTLFVDLKKAYDSVHRESLLNIMEEFNFPLKLVNPTSINVMDTLLRVQVGNTILNPITVTSRLR